MNLTRPSRSPHSGGVLAHGLLALSVHMLEHQLPAPLDIDLPRADDADLDLADHFDGLTVIVPTHAAQAWTSAGFTIDTETLSGVVTGPTGDRRWLRADGRITATGVRVRVKCLVPDITDAAPVLSVPTLTSCA